MDSNKVIDASELSGSIFPEKVKSLFEQQKCEWPFAQKNYAELKKIQRRTIEFDGFNIDIQFNPGRIISSSAKVDSKSIEARPCFLCIENLPAEQKGLAYKNKYLVLVNPFPIFSEHFTIPTFDHQPQEISSSFSDMVDLAKELSPHYTIFYNGPRCGASAPDHMHFQACPSGIIPIENELSSIVNLKDCVMYENSDSKIASATDYLRNFYIIESQSKNSILYMFDKMLKSISIAAASDEEPMVNILALYKNGWKIWIFPRERHRPSQYFLEGDERILISPAAVDFGGLVITPREEDFNKITREHIVDVFEQTSFSADAIRSTNEAFNSEV